MTDIGLRPCFVYGRHSIFHRWVSLDEIILADEIKHSSDGLKKVMDLFTETGIISVGLKLEKIKSVKGLIEFENGTVELVDISKIRFTDTEKVMEDF